MLLDILLSYTKSLYQCNQFAVKFIKDEEMFYAERIQDAVSGVGTDEQQLIRVICGRSEVSFKISNNFISRCNPELLANPVRHIGN